MFFLNPTYLWALLGLAIPLAIHLWNKREGKTIKIGSIRLLRESDPKQTSNLRLNELLLLLLRMLIITVLVIILAEPQLKSDNTGTKLTYLIEPSLLSYEEITSLLDTLNLNSETQLRLLQPGFPQYDREQQVTDSETPNYWQLAKEMENLATDSVVVFTNAFAAGVKGKRPQVRKDINWVVLDPGEPVRQVIAAHRKDDQVELISMLSDHQNLQFEKEQVEVNSAQVKITSKNDSVEVSANSGDIRLPLKDLNPLRVLIVQNDSLQQELRYLQASYKAIAAYLERPVELQVVKADSIPQDPEGFHTVIHLNAAAEVQTSAPNLIFQPNELANDLIAQGADDNQYYLTSRLNAENIVDEHLPEKLLAMLELDKDLQKEINRYDRRVVAQEELQPVVTGGVSGKKLLETTGFLKYLWMLLLALLLAERGLAKFRKQ